MDHQKREGGREGKEEDSSLILRNSMWKIVPTSLLGLHITYLSLGNNNLSCLPSHDAIPSVLGIDCDFNQITSIGYYKNLLQLSASNNRITHINSELMDSIEDLAISNNPLSFLFPIQMSNCHTLLISKCRWKDDIVNISSIPKIRILDVSNSCIKLLVFNHDCMLEELNANKNQLESIPKINSLLRLSASKNKISHLENYPLLDTLIIQNNNLHSIPPYPLITTINANNNQIKLIRSYPMLQMLDVDNNMIEKINNSKSGMLKHISICNNNLSDVQDFRYNKNLEYLIASKNNISQIHIPLSLQILDVQYNMSLERINNNVHDIQSALHTIEMPWNTYEIYYKSSKQHIIDTVFKIQPDDMKLILLHYLRKFNLVDEDIDKLMILDVIKQSDVLPIIAKGKNENKREKNYDMASLQSISYKVAKRIHLNRLRLTQVTIKVKK